MSWARFDRIDPECPRVAQAADALAGEVEFAGAKPQDTLACFSAGHRDALVQWLACSKTGVVPLPMTADFGEAQISLLLRQLNVRMKLLSQPTGAAIVPCETYDRERTAFQAPPGAVVHITSSTTGPPKLVLRTRESLRAEVHRYLERVSVCRDDVLMCTVPLWHSYGFGSAMLVAVETGATLIDPGRVLPRKTLRICHEAGVTVWHSVPFPYKKIVHAVREVDRCPRLRLCIASAGPMTLGLQAQFEDAIGVPLIQQYGSTETGSLAISEPGDPANCVGLPLHGVHVEAREVSANGSVLYVSSPETAGRYITEEGTPLSLEPQHCTGDVGYVDARGRLRIDGRADDVVIRAGKKVSLRWVEDVLRELPEIARARVSCRKVGDRPELHAEYASDSDVPYEVFVAHCSARLASHQMPKTFMRVPLETLQRSRSWKQVIV